MRYIALLFAVVAISETAYGAVHISKCKKTARTLVGCLKRNIKNNLDLVFIPLAIVTPIPDFVFKLVDYNTTGLNAVKDLTVVHDVSNHVVNVEAKFPICIGVGTYSVKGDFFNEHFDGTGLINANATQLELKYTFKGDVVQRNGKQRIERTSDEIKIVKPAGDFNIRLDNLDPRNLERAERMNALLNEHGLELFYILVPMLEQELAKTFAEVMTIVLNDI